MLNTNVTHHKMLHINVTQEYKLQIILHYNKQIYWT